MRCARCARGQLSTSSRVYNQARSRLWLALSSDNPARYSLNARADRRDSFAHVLVGKSTANPVRSTRDRHLLNP